MASVTIRNIDERVKRKLQVHAARNGRSMEEELRRAVYRLADEIEVDDRDPLDAERVYRSISALAFPKRNDGFDQKSFSDELNDFVP